MLETARKKTHSFILDSDKHYDTIIPLMMYYAVVYTYENVACEL